MAKKKNKEVLIGKIGVDAGCVLLCDPCYVVGGGPGAQKEVGDLDRMFQAADSKGFIPKGHAQLNYDLGHPMAVLVKSGYGDGGYPVYASIGPDGAVMSVRIEFISDKEG